MAPPRLVLLLLCFLVLPTFLTFFSIIHSHPKGEMATESTSAPRKHSFSAFFSFHTPSTLFPPSAIISLTDDNSTFFLARPADFGRDLPTKGLSGQLWVGSGFGDANFGRSGVITGAEGELGCSDVPGWDDGHKHHHGDAVVVSTYASNEAGSAEKNRAIQERFERGEGLSDTERIKPGTSESDGTDDHLHYPHSGSSVSKPAGVGESAQIMPANDRYPPPHADIQSLQESAEISGKVVLLSRGGCGFLEKAKWVQRRGGVALIVGDDTSGGALITMYAQGDTSNVTIPSVFTSHTTAHLLSSLIPRTRLLQGSGLTNPQKSGQAQEKSSGNLGSDRPIFTATRNQPTPSSTISSSVLGSKNKRMISTKPKSTLMTRRNEDTSWLKNLMAKIFLQRQSHASDLTADSRRPPSSGRLDWINEKFDEPQSEKKLASVQAHEGKGYSRDKVGRKSKSSGDDFVIGIQDWRDPDLVPTKPSDGKPITKPEGLLNNVNMGLPKNVESAHGKTKKLEPPLTGGIITPGSGEYEKPVSSKQGSASLEENDFDRTKSQNGISEESKESQDWLNQILYGEDSHEPSLGSSQQLPTINQVNNLYEGDKDYRYGEHQGLWITLTPTTMSTSPFFDTLLVLVVSPLITLTVVYALLLLRSRIRRRRWRAPKSVVDRLPVRIYHTMSCSSTTSSSRFVSPKASSPASPVLETNSQSNLSQPRPRSRTASGAGGAINSLVDKAISESSPSQLDKKSRSSPAKKKYAGKQVECVVCLEEYEDGQSRVMSLPCGHEFHAECM